MRKLDIIAVLLLIVGGLNWGFVGLADVDVIGEMFGKMSGTARFIYCLVGLAALYYIFQWKAMHKRCKR